jgi:hypothetical protein
MRTFSLVLASLKSWEMILGIRPLVLQALGESENDSKDFGVVDFVLLYLKSLPPKTL